MTGAKTLPLTGIRVLDLGDQIASMTTAMILADMGATTTHIHLKNTAPSPHISDAMRAVMNRNKMVIELDIHDDLSKIHTLIENTDIIIGAFSEKKFAALGIDFSALRQRRPDLITVVTPGFARSDTERQDWKTTEAVIAATCGAFNDMGFNRVLMGLNPSFSPLPLGSSYTSTLATAAAILALYEREKTGRGDQIAVPISAALMEGLSYNSYVIEDKPQRYKTMREIEIEYRRANNIPFDVSYEALQEYLDPFYRTYECADGRYFYCVAPSHKNHGARCLKALGIYDEVVYGLGLPVVDDLYRCATEWEGEIVALGVYPLPREWAKKVAPLMKKAFLTKTSEEWGRIFGEQKIPGAPHRTTEEWVQDKHNNDAGIFVEVDDPHYGVMKQPGPVLWFEHLNEEMTRMKAAQQVTFEHALETFKRAEDIIPSTRPKGQDIKPASGKGWLEGIKILDLTNVIAGPHSSAFLSRFGAEIIKIDPLSTPYDPCIGITYKFLCGVGKKSIVMDITSKEGRDIFDNMVKNADIVLINAPERQINQLHLAHDTLTKINPNILFCRLDCFGGPHRGEKTDYVGYDDIIQANSGIMLRFGGENTPEEHAHLGTIDVNCGFAAGAAMAASLFHRRRTGEISRSRTSLSATVNLTQMSFTYDYPDRPEFKTPTGRGVLGYHAWSHFYETSDGWLYLDSSPEEINKFKQIKVFAEYGDDMALHFKDIFKSHSAEAWTYTLQANDIAAARSSSIAELREQHTRLRDEKVDFENGSFAFIRDENHPSGHAVTLFDAISVNPTEAKVICPQSPERFGHSTDYILSRMGFSYDKIQDLARKRVIGYGWSKRFLPS